MSDEFSDRELLEALGVEVETEKPSARSALEERLIAGFEEIQRFVEKHGRPPQHGEERDIFERLYAVRLDRLRALEAYRGLLGPFDHQGLLSGPTEGMAEDVDDTELLKQLGVDPDTPSPLSELRHVRSAAEKRAAEEIANRKQCQDFGLFKPLFDEMQTALDAGHRQTRRFERKAEIEPSRFYVLGGQKAYVASMGETFTNDQGKTDARLRVIFDNGTESNLLLRSFQKALQQDPGGKRIVDADAGPLFSDHSEDGDESSGVIYVLRSKSDNPVVAANREVLHKIGVTGGDIERRIASARLDPTFLMADVEIVATYDLFNIHRAKLENVIHRVFSRAKLEVEIKDRFGNPIVPREWFLVPLFVIDEAVRRIRDATISDYVYDPGSAALVLAAAR